MEQTKQFKILVIDDNPSIHQDFIKILSPTEATDLDSIRIKLFGKPKDAVSLPILEIHTANQGQEGLKRIEEAIKENKPYSLAFVDIRMPPGWDGIETTERIWEIDKDIQIVICTAYSDYSWEETVSRLGQRDNLLILKKPFDNIAVRQLACALTKKWQLLQDSRQHTELLEQEVEDRTLSLQRSLSLVKATFESSSDAILVVSTHGDLIDHNKKFCDMWHIPRHLLSQTPKEIFQHLDSQLQNSARNFFSKMQFMNKEMNEVKIDKLLTHDKRIIECYSQPENLNGETIGRVYAFRDITLRTKLEEELKHRASHDTLTALPNRAFLLEQLKKYIEAAEQSKLHIAILFLDLDRFKLVNDSLSHAVGDELLKLAAYRLQSVMRAEDTLARLGGDEFVIVLTNIANIEDITNKTQQFLNVFRQPFKIDERAITLHVSIGISIYPNDGTTTDILLRNADTAMYIAKAAGGDRHQIYQSDMNKKNVARLDQESQLRAAIKNNEFFLCYQPQFDLVHKNLIAVEALVRWHHPTKGDLLPLEFIKLAEETGLTVPIGEWVMRTACKQNKEWQEKGFPKIRVAVNVTPEQFKQDGLVELVDSILKETQLEPQYLEIEITENVIISHVDVIDKVKQLKNLGVNIALDDFGTGYSSLGFLKKIPLDRLKIDGSFVQHIQKTRDDDIVVRAIISMAKNLNLDVLAEGVETEKQLEFLHSQNCDEIQGFYLSKPLEKDAMEKIFKHKDYQLILDSLLKNK